MPQLTQKFVEHALCPQEIRMKTIYDSLGLQLRIMRATQKKSWLFQYRWERKLTQISLGSYPQMTLAKAREERDRLRIMLSNGINPKTARAMEKTKNIDEHNNTIESLFNAVCKERVNHPTHPWTEGTLKRSMYLWKHLKHLGHIPIGNLSKSKLRTELVKIAMDKGAATGQKAKVLMGMIYGYAEMNEFVPRNIVRDFANDPILRKPKAGDVKSHPYIIDEDIGKTYYLLSIGKASLSNKYFIRILSYTALRVGSLIGLKWSDYDEIKSILNIPKELVKNRKSIECPLPYQGKQYLAELKQLQQNIQGKRWNTDMPIFSDTGDKPLQHAAVSKYLGRIQQRNDLPHSVLHGFRTQCLIFWSKNKCIDNAVRLQMDHSVISNSSVQDRYLGTEQYLSERFEMVQMLANYIDEQVSLYRDSLAD